MRLEAHDEAAGRAVFERRRVDAPHGVAELSGRPRGGEGRHAARGKRRVVAEKPSVQLLRPDNAARAVHLERAGQADIVIVFEANAETINGRSAIDRIGQIGRIGARDGKPAARPAEGEVGHRLDLSEDGERMSRKKYQSWRMPWRKLIGICASFFLRLRPPDVRKVC
ncbi:MAG: hypothetical protein ACREEM_24895 [Blastocatellia bacterium]